MGISSLLGSSALLPAGLGFRNLVINGNMAIDQRNSGASVTAVTSGLYSLDRWSYYLSASSKMSIQRLTSTPPAGFAYYQRVTSLAATADAAGNYFTINQVVEGFNSAQLSWGTANAKPAMLSFWVRSSLTGTFGGALRNAGSGGFYTYSFTYTINSANTWEYKTVSIPGSTAGTWATDNGAGIYLFFDMGCNSDNTQAAGSWNNVNKLGANGCTRLIGTNGATWDITGVQLEQNYQPTPFEQRPIGVELVLCQRYYEISNGIVQVTAGATGFGGNTYWSWMPYGVEKRISLNYSTNTAANGLTIKDNAGVANQLTYWKSATQYTATNIGFEVYTNKGHAFVCNGGQTDAGLARYSWVANAEL